ncbi:hypothetical protein C6P61_10565 [Malikia spinosa]|uniref:IS30 family transposase n=1 Tax=Malikia spinosa TaxID=86180 RepID=A0A2S9KDN4_9BURK|nr:hypothetical protein C6P61_10565 [Malikia spinosa]
MQYLLRQRWSSEQIALTLAHIYPEGNELRVSHEIIYNFIYTQPVDKLHKYLIACLHNTLTKNAHHTAKARNRCRQFPDMLSIHTYPAKKDNR